MNVTSDPERFFSARHHLYARFIRLVRYQRGLRAVFLTSPLLRSGLRILDAGCGTGALTLAVRDALVRRKLAPGTLQAFDLTPAMLDHFRATMQRRGIGTSNPVTRLLSGRWWASNLYTKRERRNAFRAAGFSAIAFRRFPLTARYLAVWGHVAEARP